MGALVGVTVAVLVVPVGPTSTVVATTSAENALLLLINEARAAHGAPPWTLSEELSRVADRHSAQMASGNRLFHSCLSCLLRGRPWDKLGENVGRGKDFQQVHELMMASGPHRENLLDHSYERVGVGIARRDGQVWVTELFQG